MTVLSSVGLFLCPRSAYFDGSTINEDNLTNRFALPLKLIPALSSPDDENTSITVIENGKKEIKINLVQIPKHSPIISDLTNELMPRIVADRTLNMNKDALDLIENPERLPMLNNQTIVGNNSFSFQNNLTEENNILAYFTDLNNEPETTNCAHPEYIVFTWILCLVSLATALKLYYLVKVIMAVCMVAFYATLIHLVFPHINPKDMIDVEQSRLGMPLGLQMLMLLAAFLVMVCYHARLVEVRFFTLSSVMCFTER